MAIFDKSSSTNPSPVPPRLNMAPLRPSFPVCSRVIFLIWGWRTIATAIPSIDSCGGLAWRKVEAEVRRGRRWMEDWRGMAESGVHGAGAGGAVVALLLLLLGVVCGSQVTEEVGSHWIRALEQPV